MIPVIDVLLENYIGLSILKNLIQDLGATKFVSTERMHPKLHFKPMMAIMSFWSHRLG